MIWFQIFILVLGIVIFIVSFLLSEKVGERFDKRETEQEIKKFLSDEMKRATEQFKDASSETIHEAIEKTERSLERISNDKIMAVNEYSETVLNDIHKNHEEVMFLYSMLNDKHEQLKESVSSLEKATKDAQKSINVLEKPTEIKQIQAKPDNNIEEAKEVIEENALEELVSALDAFSKQPEKKQATPEKKNGGSKKTSQRTGRKAKNMPEIQSRDAKENHNEEILKLHKEGKSNVSIAKELGLGVGEVKLVIDLFRQG